MTGVLHKGKLVVRSTQRLVRPDGSELSERAVVTGQGSRLNVIEGRDWFTLDL